MRSDVSSARIIALYRRGASIREVAAACGCSPKTVHRRLDAAGVRRRRAGGSPSRGRHVELAAEQVADAVAVYTSGRASLEALGRRYGVSGDTVGRRLRRAGVKIRARGRPLALSPGPDAAAVRRLHAAGLTDARIARRLDCKADGVARVRRAAGLRANRGRPLPPPAELAAAYRSQGSVRALARRYRAAEDRIAAALTDAGVPVGRRRHHPDALAEDQAGRSADAARPGRAA
jgi:transposase-like protein